MENLVGAAAQVSLYANSLTLWNQFALINRSRLARNLDTFLCKYRFMQIDVTVKFICFKKLFWTCSKSRCVPPRLGAQ